MIGIIGAMQIEVDALRNAMTERKDEKIGDAVYSVGKLCGKDVAITGCGIGKVYAAMAAQTMILRFSPDALLNTGVAGSLEPSLDIGDIAVATACVEHDMDTSPLGDPKGYVSGIGRVEFACDEKLRETVLAATASLGIPSASGIVASGDQFIADAERKKFIRETFGAVACEMEAGAIAHVATVNGVPFAVIRAISDKADGSAELSYTEFLPLAAKRSTETVLKFLSLLD